MTQAIIYARFSPRRNAAQCESVETQIDLCRDFCDKNGYEITDILHDKNLSGSDENRSGLWNAIELLKRNYLLVVYRLDRLARSVYLSHIIEQAVKKQNASIISVSGEGTWDDNAESELIRNILHALADYQRKAAAARTKAAMLRHQANGRRMSSEAPFGFSIDPESPDKLIDNITEQQTITLVTKLSQDSQSLRQICRELTTAGHKPRGKYWHHSTIKRILRRENEKK